MRFQAQHGLASHLNAREKHQRTGLERVFGDRFVGDARDKPKRAFRADHQVRQDVNRVFKIDQCIQAVAGGVFDLVFVANARCQHLIFAGDFAQVLQFVYQGGVALPKAGHTEGVFGVKHGAIAQHHPHTGQRAVAVLRGATTHAGGVVGGNATNLAGVDGGRVGPDLAPVRCQAKVHLAANDAGADPHRGCIRANLASGKPFTNQGQHAVGDSLA